MVLKMLVYLHVWLLTRQSFSEVFHSFWQPHLTFKQHSLWNRSWYASGIKYILSMCRNCYPHFTQCFLLVTEMKMRFIIDI